MGRAKRTAGWGGRWLILSQWRRGNDRLLRLVWDEQRTEGGLKLLGGEGYAYP